ncbi:putative minor fimbrial subunit StfF [Serratia marcescens]|uniref:fimbrial protein n=1 Tax=Serratia marcescens TaxID=615 RepID=UPI0018D64964|nr:fimbrial protein [Serratia marcescens]ELA7783997.1 fimbrial protein [Serratia marcescens]MBH2971151.1 fimbrial protein [Serratia marcescens]MBN6138807.1 fimbrial protein [Serratia marcescens]CAI1189881.1 putative minor fimbrial subunit StfF [Serratia marcescens]CAI1204364.1 putative minor fimbrial subunit StfF [Serratia marcescens]
MKRYSGIAWLFASSTLSSAGMAAENMAFFGTLVEPPACTINNGGLVDVDFGNRVGIKKVDGVNYLQPMNYQINCDPNAQAWAMTLEIVGVSADYDRAAVVTGVKDLAIQIKQNGVPFELNKPIPIQLTNPPHLEAVPVKRQRATLKEGPFEATATLKAVYQ